MKISQDTPLLDNQDKYCIKVTNLKKQYGKGKAFVINDISFSVKYGTVFGFLGPNGAGKTTTLKILTSLINASSGSVTIFGKDFFKKQSEIKRKIGVVSQNPSFESNLTVERSLDLYGLLWGLNDRRVRKSKVKEILNTFDLESIKNSKNDELSIGQRRRVQLAREFMHDMDLLFLDEPTVGLDPSARRMLLDYIKKHVMSGLTVFFTTHIMEEAEYLCDEIAIIDNGKIIAFDTPSRLKQRYGRMNKSLDITFKNNLDESFIDMLMSIVKQDKKVSNGMNNDFGSNIPEISFKGDNSVRIKVNDTEKVISEIFQIVPKNDMEIESISVNSPSLEDIFLTIVRNSKENSNNR